MFSYLLTYYKAIDVDSYLIGNETVNVTKEKDYYLFDGIGTDNALIFYPGGKVDEKAYAELMFTLASVGIDCYLVKMPFHLAVFGSNRANNIINENKYNNYYIGGHSLGGAMASTYVSKHDDVKGLILLAAYSSVDISEKDIDVLSIYGDTDGVLSMEKYEKCLSNLPNDYEEYVIGGENHANFASYGKQKNDNDTNLDRHTQIILTVYNIYDFIK